MTMENAKKINRILAVMVVLVFILCVIIVKYRYRSDNPLNKHLNSPQTSGESMPDSRTVSESRQDKQPSRHAIKDTKVISYQDENVDNDQTAEMDSRKAKYGIKDSVDLIVRENEFLRIGDQQVAMQQIADKMKLARGEVVEQDLIKMGHNSDSTQVGSRPESEFDEFGVYVVQPGDNIWNIHFGFLREYFAQKNMVLSNVADEPKQPGKSSGVGKLLKFSENMVSIFNLSKNQFETDINLIHPNSKIVVFNIKSIHAFLDQIDTRNMDFLRFDGQTLWIPAMDE